MLKKAELNEITALTGIVLDRLSVGCNISGQTGANVIKQISYTKKLVDYLPISTMANVGTAMKSCIELAFNAGVEAENFRSIRLSLQQTESSNNTAAKIAVGYYCLVLAYECRCLARKEFKSTRDVDKYLVFANDAFDHVEEIAADLMLTELFTKMTFLRSATIHDLIVRAKQLPKLYSLNTPASSNTLVLSYKLYGSIEKSDEIASENLVTHPAFLPRQLTVLSQ
ncbi:hypothetical protein RAM19_05840 [Bartonella apihabitans]|nr:hypothetical protein [Bartonella apihabitans]WLT09651.1 hypothetical protein RAM19_05840 [Bartonella apihabitans]